ncbi:MAG: excisionase family DNA-binding protein [Clostridiales bacterium]|nr:excisionase family DNA-binding protein [Clostridiales bacterium]
MNKKIEAPDFTPIKPFLTINEAAAWSGLGRDYLRKGCKAGTIPHIKSGTKYLINASKLLALEDSPD